jgi:hypothetical protein
MGDGRWAMGDGRWTMGDGRWTRSEGRGARCSNAHLTLTDANGGIVLSGDVLLVRVDQLAMENATTNLINVPSIGLLVITKFAA